MRTNLEQPSNTLLSIFETDAGMVMDVMRVFLNTFMGRVTTPSGRTYSPALAAGKYLIIILLFSSVSEYSNRTPSTDVYLVS